MPTGPEVRREARRGLAGNPSATSSTPVGRGLPAAHAHDLVVCPREAAAAVPRAPQGAAGEITERSET